MEDEIEQIPEEVNAIFDALLTKCMWMREDWTGFEVLYGDQATVDVLNATALTFFARLQGILWEYTLLSIARLFDPPNSGGSRTNLTLSALIESMQARTDDAGVREIANDFTALRSTVQPAIAQRHKRIAHLDREVGLGRVIVPNHTRNEISRALHGIEALLGKVDAYYGRSDTEFDNWYVGSDIRSILTHLKAARTLEDRDRVGRARSWTPKSDYQIDSDDDQEDENG